MHILGSSNKEYHSNKTHLSSSSLKTLLKSPEQFHRHYVLGLKVEEERDVFTEGKLVHSLILEPEKLNSEYAIFSGLRKYGKLWDEFKQQNQGKTCISAPQMIRAEKLVRSCSALPAALDLLKDTLPEHNMVAELLNVPVKARADAINLDKHYMVDVKTTSMPSDIDFFRNTVKDYMYQLSAALYCEIAQQVYGHPFDFYWLVLSKIDEGCEIYKVSDASMTEGAAMVAEALLMYKHCTKTGQWEQKQRKNLPTIANYEILEV